MKILIDIFIATLLVAGCSGCQDASNAGDSGLDTASDTTSSSEDTSGTETDTETASETYTGEPGDWEWTPNPDGEDCGPGCKQLTFVKEVRSYEWDVWDDMLVFRTEQDPDVTPNVSLYIVNISEQKHARLPNPGVMFGSSDMHPFYPSIYMKKVYWGGKSYDTPQTIAAILEADITQKIIRVVHKNDVPVGPAKYMDVYEDKIVSQGGCGTALEAYPLCIFDLSTSPATVTVALEDHAAWTSLWDGKVVFTDSRYNDNYNLDVTMYDIAAGQFVPIAAEPNYTAFPGRIQGHRVVYNDLRYGTSQDAIMGDWDHAAVFVHDLDTGQKRQVTNAQWIAATPDIYGDVVVWLDYRNALDPNWIGSSGDKQVWGYNLVTNVTAQITNLPADQDPDRAKICPHIFGDKVFVEMGARGVPGVGYSIFMFDLPEALKTPK